MGRPVRVQLARNLATRRQVQARPAIADRLPIFIDEDDDVRGTGKILWAILLATVGCEPPVAPDTGEHTRDPVDVATAAIWAIEAQQELESRVIPQPTEVGNCNVARIHADEGGGYSYESSAVKLDVSEKDSDREHREGDVGVLVTQKWRDVTLVSARCRLPRNLGKVNRLVGDLDYGTRRSHSGFSTSETGRTVAVREASALSLPIHLLGSLIQGSCRWATQDEHDDLGVWIICDIPGVGTTTCQNFLFDYNPVTGNCECGNGSSSDDCYNDAPDVPVGDPPVDTDNNDPDGPGGPGGTGGTGVAFTLELLCPPSVYRGDPGTCNATTSHDSATVSFFWSFVPDATPLFGSGGPTGLEGWTTPTQSGDGVDSWGGIWAKSGQVRVTAISAAGDTAEAVAPVYVPPITGATTSETLTRDHSAWGAFPGPGVALGDNRDASGISAMAFAGTDPGVSPAITSGPNAGLRWASGNLHVARSYVINQYIEEGGPETVTWPLQGGGSVVISNWAATDSAGVDPAIFRDGIVGHESYGIPGGKGHQGEMKKGLAHACGNVNALVARWVGSSESGLRQLIEEVQDYLVAAFDAAHNRVGGIGSGNLVAQGENNWGWMTIYEPTPSDPEPFIQSYCQGGF